MKPSHQARAGGASVAAERALTFNSAAAAAAAALERGRRDVNKTSFALPMVHCALRVTTRLLSSGRPSITQPTQIKHAEGLIQQRKKFNE
jgi:hypothetical protein